LIKVVTLHTFGDNDKLRLGYAITTLNIHRDYLVTGFIDGSVKFYDFYFKVKAWFEDLGIKKIKSVSFSNLPPDKIEEHGHEVIISQKESKEESKEDLKDEQPFACS
jgi:hypothetical protein